MLSPGELPDQEAIKRVTMHWRYFQALESDVANTGRYVEMCEANWNTFSIEYTRLLLAIGSEVDVVAKLLCSLLSPNETPTKIVEYQPIITRIIPRFASEHVRVAGIVFQPWQEWGATPPASPIWWKDYNGVKHDRTRRFAEACLGNVLYALGGLYILIKLCYPAGRYWSHEPRHTKLVDYD